MTKMKQHILDAVKHNKLHMVPKWQFVLYSVLAVVGVMFLVVVAVFVVSLGLFIFSRYGLLSLPLRDFISLLHTIHTLPIVLFVVTLLFVIVAELIARRYTFFARRPLFVTLGGVTLAVFVVGLIISDTPLHEYVREYAKTHRLELMTRMYDRPLRKGGMKDMIVVRGELQQKTQTTAQVLQFNEELVQISATSAQAVVDLDTAQNGDDVAVFGVLQKNNTIEIVRISKAGSVTPFGKPPHYRPGTRPRDGMHGMMGGDSFYGDSVGYGVSDTASSTR